MPVFSQTDSSRVAVTEAPWLEPQSELSTPNQTVTIVIDQAQGVMDIFTEHDPHPEDWEITCELIRWLCSPGSVGEPDYLKGVDTFRIKLKS